MGIQGTSVKIEANKVKKIKVFLSYSWDDEEHRSWVLNLANELTRAGIEVIFDQYDLKPGKSLNFFIDENISRAQRIIAIYTPKYKQKANKRKGGVGYEYSIINSQLYENQVKNQKVIPVLRRGTSKTSIPNFMRQYLHIDMTDNNCFESKFEELLRELYDVPKVQRPILGKQPIFK